MRDSSTKPLSDQDILRLGIETGLRVQAMPEFPSQSEIDNTVDELGMRAVELAYTQSTTPEED